MGLAVRLLLRALVARDDHDVLRVRKLAREVTPLLDQSLDVVAIAERIISPCPDLLGGVDVDQHLLHAAAAAAITTGAQ